MLFVKFAAQRALQMRLDPHAIPRGMRWVAHVPNDTVPDQQCSSSNSYCISCSEHAGVFVSAKHNIDVRISSKVAWGPASDQCHAAVFDVPRYHPRNLPCQLACQLSWPGPAMFHHVDASVHGSTSTHIFACTQHAHCLQQRVLASTGLLVQQCVLASTGPC